MTSVVLDGIRTHHFGVSPDVDAVTEVMGLLGALTSDEPFRAGLVRLHELLAGVSALTVADGLVHRLRQGTLPAERVRWVGRHLAEHGTRREAVKTGLVLLGACGDERDRDLLLLLGTLEEFTLYAAVALDRTLPDGRRAVYDLARRVRGWGRIHAVERLRGCDDPEIRDWLLRDGFRNEIMDEYLAHIAATTGGLYSALNVPEVDDALLDGAGGILAALAAGGPAEDMADYGDAVPALGRFAFLAADRPATLGRLDSLLSILAFLRDPGDDRSWPAEELRRLRLRYEELAAEPRWGDLVRAHLADPRRTDFDRALWAAERLALPVLPLLTARLEVEPLDESTWHHAVRLAGPREIEGLCHLAERLLPLPDPAGGPADRFGLGAEFAPDRALEDVVNGLGTFPGTGLPLILAALRSRVTRVRRAALATLAAWPAAAVPDEALDRVRRAMAVEPHEETRVEMASFLGDR
ncbi:hypothetical protein [Streptosporangium pseudovulgare]|nr:hypothetical protein [Streptosporangium pseudovulgare]